MGDVNRIPRGFLDLIGAQTQGKNPPVFSDGLSPIVDMTPLYLAQTLGTHKETLLHSNNAEQLAVVVPSDEVWWLLSVATTSLSTVAGSFEQWAFIIKDVIRETGGATHLPAIHVSPLVTISLINQLLATGHTLPAPILIQGGMELIAKLMQRDANAARFAQIEYLFYRLKG